MHRRHTIEGRLKTMLLQGGSVFRRPFEYWPRTVCPTQNPIRVRFIRLSLSGRYRQDGWKR
ncbi:hypothetical protein NEIELOOT_02994 [Neisseria elongata subsp. glycolytica ATCC 29315]|uniref:Uncharacterized protein n=1 Tax=Neisseria elongata subsp. glycolytica ATCC 29315 TaxID=546263 RepID=D4DV78_NEIEG|nr:hypothetical protein NEIELOOT_02994 [Neisseria elongata subsp. glycolytica ATCC 29315]